VASRAAAVAALLLLGSGAEVPPAPGRGAPSAPAYDAAGRLLRPPDYRTWVFVGASLGLSYGAGAGGEEAFHHTYLRPDAYESYRRTGTFPEGTMLVLEAYEAAAKVAPGRHGRFEGRRTALEAAVKDGRRFPEGWAYFSFGDGGAPSARPFDRASCFECHRQHAGRDNVFTQFYPVLREAFADGGDARH
jgi:hypothetical protein